MSVKMNGIPYLRIKLSVEQPHDDSQTYRYRKKYFPDKA